VEPIGVRCPTRASPAQRLRVLEARRAQWLHPGFKLELFHDERKALPFNLSWQEAFVFVNCSKRRRGVPKSSTVTTTRRRA